MKIGIIANRTKPGAPALLRGLQRVCEEAGAELLLEASTAALIRQKGLKLASLLKKVDLMMIAGGDGSLLRVLHQIYPSPVPLLGINIGSLGFLTAMTREEIIEVVVNILHGKQKLRLSPRLALSAKVHSRLGDATIPCALNDIVVFRGNATRMVKMRVFIDDILINEYTADGLIVATPTGSTAYAMAAGGPIISPETQALYLNPICPHSLSNRGLVFSSDCILRVEIPGGAATVQLQYDGHSSHKLHPGDWLEIRAAVEPVMLAFLAERDFYTILRQKLKWSGASV